MKYINNFVLKSDAIAAEDVVSPDVSYCVENNQLLVGIKGLADETSLKIVADGPDRLKYFIPYDYLAFTCVSDGGISMTNYGDNLPNVEYSKNGGDWVEWDYSNIELTSGDVVNIRGNNPSGFSYNDVKYSSFVVTTGEFNLSGNIMCLIDNIGSTNVMPNCPSCFFGLFKHCTAIKTCCKLPATELYGACYFGLFYDCGIVDASGLELPAMDLTYAVDDNNNVMGCYQQMFFSCSSLTSAPSVLPATGLSYVCYAYMFMECDSLVSVPELPANQLSYACYINMFEGCGKLTVAQDELPALGLSEYCYSAMFSGCTALLTAPKLPATTLADGCYEFMFNGCSKLVNVQTVLPATTLAPYCYGSMFNGCSSLVVAPDLPALTLPAGTYEGPTTHGGAWGSNYGCYSHMFFNCINLTKAPVLSAQTLTESCYVGMFSRCSSLMEITCLATSIAIENENDFVSKHAAVINFMYGMNSNAVLKVPTGMKAEWEKTDSYYQNYKTIVEI